jgi:ribosome biogenesis GTPase
VTSDFVPWRIRIVQTLNALGWSDRWQAALGQLDDGRLVPARISEEHRDRYRALGDGTVWTATLPGALRHRAADRAELPAVGDWVALRPGSAMPGPDGVGEATIVAVLPRRSAIVRKQAGVETAVQVLAANLDTIFLVTDTGDDFNVRRIERMLAVIWESGASPVLLLNKVDLCEDAVRFVDEAAAVALGVPIHPLSALRGDGVEAITPYVAEGRSIALIGSSGVGKSTLVNLLAGLPLMEVHEIRAGDGRGRHTTTHRQLLVLPRGGVLIDTPGMREVALWSAGDGVGATFADIEELADRCHFADCRHDSEPGCAVLEAVESGALDAGRLASYRKLQREVAFLERQRDHRARREEQRRWRSITRSMRQWSRQRGR